jgi:hypothetical protein
MRDGELFKFYMFPSHNYLQVKVSELGDWTPSEYSFTDGEYAYLEEDCDAFEFCMTNNIPTSQLMGVPRDDDIREWSELRRFSGETDADIAYQRRMENRAFDQESF